MPELRKIPFYDSADRDVFVFLIGTLVMGRLERVDDHYVYRPKSMAFKTRVFHDFNEAHEALLRYDHER